jgi:hypothetical protein
MTKTLVERLRAKRTILRLEAASRIEELEAAMGDIAEGLVPPIPHGHYLAHRHAVNVARVALRQALPDKG